MLLSCLGSDTKNVAPHRKAKLPHVPRHPQVSARREAIRARVAGIHILSVGTLNADQNEVRSFSSVPQILNTNYFYTPFGEQLRNVRSDVSSQLCLHSSLGDLYCKNTRYGYQCFCREEQCYYRTMNGTQCTGEFRLRYMYSSVPIDSIVQDQQKYSENVCWTVLIFVHRPVWVQFARLLAV